MCAEPWIQISRQVIFVSPLRRAEQALRTISVAGDWTGDAPELSVLPDRNPIFDSNDMYSWWYAMDDPWLDYQELLGAVELCSNEPLRAALYNQWLTQHASGLVFEIAREIYPPEDPTRPMPDFLEDRWSSGKSTEMWLYLRRATPFQVCQFIWGARLMLVRLLNVAVQVYESNLIYENDPNVKQLMTQTWTNEHIQHRLAQVRRLFADPLLPLYAGPFKPGGTVWAANSCFAASAVVWLSSHRAFRLWAQIIYDLGAQADLTGTGDKDFLRDNAEHDAELKTYYSQESRQRRVQVIDESIAKVTEPGASDVWIDYLPTLRQMRERQQTGLPLTQEDLEILMATTRETRPSKQATLLPPVARVVPLAIFVHTKQGGRIAREVATRNVQLPATELKETVEMCGLRWGEMHFPIRVVTALLQGQMAWLDQVLRPYQTEHPEWPGALTLHWARHEFEYRQVRTVTELGKGPEPDTYLDVNNPSWREVIIRTMDDHNAVEQYLGHDWCAHRRIEFKPRVADIKRQGQRVTASVLLRPLVTPSTHVLNLRRLAKQRQGGIHSTGVSPVIIEPTVTVPVTIPEVVVCEPHTWYLNAVTISTNTGETGGHWFAYVAGSTADSPPRRQWYQANDAHITPIKGGWDAIIGHPDNGIPPLPKYPRAMRGVNVSENAVNLIYSIYPT